MEKKGERGSSYEDFLKSLPENDARFAVFDYHFTNAEKREINKIFFFSFVPKNCSVKTKFSIASTKEEVKSKL